MEKVWHHTFNNELRISPDESPILHRPPFRDNSIIFFTLDKEEYDLDVELRKSFYKRKLFKTFVFFSLRDLSSNRQRVKSRSQIGCFFFSFINTKFCSYGYTQRVLKYTSVQNAKRKKKVEKIIS